MGRADDSTLMALLEDPGSRPPQFTAVGRYNLRRRSAPGTTVGEFFDMALCS